MASKMEGRDIQRGQQLLIDRLTRMGIADIELVSLTSAILILYVTGVSYREYSGAFLVRF